jgi:hypothetical protein
MQEIKHLYVGTPLGIQKICFEFKGQRTPKSAPTHSCSIRAKPISTN